MHWTHGFQPVICLHAGALKSRADWSNPCRNWRKREAYIALMRNVQDCANYHQWDCFRLQDYTQRQRWAVTFNARHLPLSNGDPANFSGRLPNPAWWDGSHKLPNKKSKKQAGTPTSHGAMLVLDRHTGEFVALAERRIT